MADLVYAWEQSGKHPIVQAALPRAARRTHPGDFCQPHATAWPACGGCGKIPRMRPVGAAGAQVPYKHKVGGSNPSPATIEQPQARACFCSGLSYI